MSTCDLVVPFVFYSSTTCRGDALIVQQASTVYTSKKASIPKGIAFPTSLSLNNVVSHFSPMPSDKDVPVLKDGDVVKVMMGVHIDGYASVHAETLVVGASEGKKVEGVKADALKAAWEASQVAVS
jgi:methionine aminopeptidase